MHWNTAFFQAVHDKRPGGARNNTFPPLSSDRRSRQADHHIPVATKVHSWAIACKGISMWIPRAPRCRRPLKRTKNILMDQVLKSPIGGGSSWSRHTSNSSRPWRWAVASPGSFDSTPKRFDAPGQRPTATRTLPVQLFNSWKGCNLALILSHRQKKDCSNQRKWSKILSNLTTHHFLWLPHD